MPPIHWFVTEGDKILINRMQFTISKTQLLDDENTQHKYLLLINGAKEIFLLDLLRYKENDIIDPNFYKVRINDQKKWFKDYENLDNIEVREIKVIK